MGLKLKPGVHLGVDFKDYLTIDAFSKSCVPYIMKSPNHYLAWKDEQKTSESLTKGNLLECLLLESSKFGDQFVLQPPMVNHPDKGDLPWNNRLKVCQDWNESQKAKGLTVVSDEQMQEAQLMINSLTSNPTIKQALEERIAEQVTVIWKDQTFGVLCKARYDFITKDANWDLKSTKDASPAGFGKEAYNFGYHIQAALYTDAWAALNQGELKPFHFACVENVKPYCSAWHNLCDASFAAGQAVYKHALKKWKTWKQSGKDYGYGTAMFETSIPAWALTQAEQMGDPDDLGI